MHVRHPNPRMMRTLNHEQAVEARERKRKEREAKRSKAAGWKEEISSGDVPDWKKGNSGGDWRSGESGGDWRGGGRRSQSPQRG